MTGRPAPPDQVWIAVLGCPSSPHGTPSTSQVRRLRHAWSLWRGAPGARFLLLGGAAHNRIVESATMRAYLETLGIPSASIRVEDRTRTTRAQVQFLRRFAGETRPRSLILVSDRLHLWRTALYLRRAGSLPCAFSFSAAPLPALADLADQAVYEAAVYAEDLWGALSHTLRGGR